MVGDSQEAVSAGFEFSAEFVRYDAAELTSGFRSNILGDR